MTAGLAPCLYTASAALALLVVVTNDWVKVGVAAKAFVLRQAPPSRATVVPLSHRISVLPLTSPGSNTMSLTLRLPVQGLSKQPSLPVPSRTPIRVTATEAGAPVTPVSLYRPRRPSGGMVPPNGASPPMPITPPAVPTKSVVGSLGTIRILLTLRPVKTDAETATFDALR